MSVNTWDILQLIFMVWVFGGAFIAPFIFIAVMEMDRTKYQGWLVIGAVVVWTVLVLIGGFLYYKNMETKCMYDPGFSGPCLQKELT